MSDGSDNTIKSGGMELTTAIFLVVIFVVMMVLFWVELMAHDCVGDKQCTHRQEEPEAEDSIDEYIDKLSAMIQGNSDFII